ncbi:hypothetical protein TNCV_4460441 [Trichonephila clavipes]|nr:hypothetical protein TNCV_4460441 [Trichonephila clavipes]
MKLYLRKKVGYQITRYDGVRFAKTFARSVITGLFPVEIPEVADNLGALHFKYDFWHMTATAGLDVVQSGCPIFNDFFQHLWLYIGNNTANVFFQMVKRLWPIRIDQ